MRPYSASISGWRGSLRNSLNMVGSRSARRLPCQSHTPALRQGLQGRRVTIFASEAGEIGMIRGNHKILARFAAALIACSAPAGAIAEQFHRGYLIDEQLLSRVKPGMSAEQ